MLKTLSVISIVTITPAAHYLTLFTSNEILKMIRLEFLQIGW